MIKYMKGFGSFSVDDTEKAKVFYGGLLGLSVTENHGMLEVALPGGGNMLLYPKPDHRPATFTVLNFKVTQLEKVVARLKSEGVPFEHYADPETDENNIHHRGNHRVAWFRDPAGNILSVMEGEM